MYRERVTENQSVLVPVRVHEGMARVFSLAVQARRFSALSLLVDAHGSAFAAGYSHLHSPRCEVAFLYSMILNPSRN